MEAVYSITCFFKDIMSPSTNLEPLLPIYEKSSNKNGIIEIVIHNANYSESYEFKTVNNNNFIICDNV